MHWTYDSIKQAMRRPVYQLQQELLNDGVLDLENNHLANWSRDELISCWLRHYGDREIQPSIIEQVEAVSLDIHALDRLYSDVCKIDW